MVALMEGSRSERHEFVLRMGDSTLILAQRLIGWVGHGPVLEEELATANVALDLIGQARLWYAYVSELEDGARSEDELAFGRDAAAWRNFLLVEQGNGNYGDTITRQFLFDCWHQLMLTGLAASGDARIAGIAAKSLKEVDYHLRRSADLVVRLGDGTAHSHQLMQSALERLWRFTGELTQVDVLYDSLAAAGVVPPMGPLASAWHDHVAAILARATLKLPVDQWMQTGGIRGTHGEEFGYLLAEMQFLPRAYPGAQW